MCCSQPCEPIDDLNYSKHSKQAELYIRDSENLNESTSKILSSLSITFACLSLTLIETKQKESYTFLKNEKAWAENNIFGR